MFLLLNVADCLDPNFLGYITNLELGIPSCWVRQNGFLWLGREVLMAGRRFGYFLPPVITDNRKSYGIIYTMSPTVYIYMYHTD